MFAGKRKTRLAMVHRLSTGLPVNQRKVHSVMVGVALGTILTCYIRPDPDRMHTAILNEPIANFRMAVQAFQLHPASPTQVVAFRAVQNPIERRSEEHTSELQSLTNLVCRLLLEKKKTE